MATPAQQPIDLPRTSDHKYNDSDNANDLIALYGDQIRYVKGWGWLAWDGQRWERDADDQVMELAKKTLRQLLWDAASMPDYARSARISHLCRSLDTRNLKAMVDNAQTDPRIRKQVADFDKDPWLFNAQNVTVNLKSGETHEHSPEDHITKVAACDYDPEAHSEEWEKFILWASKNRENLRDYLQKALGYSLSGSIGDKSFFYCFGGGDNGKTTILEVVAHIMGDYAGSVPIESVISKGGVSGNEIRENVQLVGKRLIIATEPDAGQSFRIARIKSITGGDSLTAADLYQSRYNFVPILKLWIGGNHKPNVPDNGDAAWNRLRLVPFDNQIEREKRDEGKKARLQTTEAAGILAWLVRGCQKWLAEGLQEPDCMVEAQKDYREEQDTFQAFLDECCEAAEGTETPMKELLQRYTRWGYDNEDAPELNAKTIRPEVETHHYKAKRRTGGLRVLGLRLKEEPKPSYQPAQSQPTPTTLSDDFDGVNF